MEIKLSNQLEGFKAIMSTVVGFVKEGSLEFKPDGVYLREMDSTQAVLVDFRIDKTAFDIYNVTTPLKIKMDFDRLSNYLSNMVEFACLNVNENNVEVAEGSKKFAFRTLHAGNEDPINLPDFGLPFSMNTTWLTMAINDAKLIAEETTLNLGNRVLKVSCHSPTSEYDVTTPVDSDMVAESRFNNAYLQNFLKASRLSGTIQAKMGNLTPLRLTLTNEKFKLEVVIASMCDVA